MASRYPEDSNIQEEADSDNEVILVHRKPDRDQADATRIPGRPLNENDNMSSLEMRMANCDVQETEVKKDQDDEIVKLKKEMSELKAFLVKYESEKLISQEGGKLYNGKTSLQESAQFNVGGSIFPRLSVKAGEVADPIDTQLGRDRLIPGRVGPDALGQGSQRFYGPQYTKVQCLGSSAVPSSNARLTVSPGVPRGLDSATLYSGEIHPRQMAQRGNIESGLNVDQSISNDTFRRSHSIYGRNDVEQFHHSPVNQSKKKPATYDGLTSWHDYVTQFELVSDINQWNKDVMALELATSLRGQAQGVLSDLSPSQRRDYEVLTKALEERFEPVNQAELYRAQLKSRIRKSREALPEFAQDIKKLVRKAYPKATSDLRNKLTCDAFVDLLNDSELEWAIYQSKPSSVEDAVRAGLECEAFRVGRQRRTGQRVAVRMQKEEDYSDIANLSDQLSETAITEVAGRVAQLMNNNKGKVYDSKSNKANWNRKGRCHICNREGHWRRECPQRDQMQIPKSGYTPKCKSVSSQSCQTDTSSLGN